MTDEVQLEESSTPIVETPEAIPAVTEAVEAAPVREYTEIEKQAMEMGWKPEEEFKGEPALFKSAEKYIEQKPLYDKLEAANRKAREVEKLLKQNIEYSRKLAEQNKQKELELAAAKRKEAIENADLEEFNRADEEYQKIAQANIDIPTVAEPAPITKEDQAEIDAFLVRNKSWCNDETEAGRTMKQAVAQMVTVLEQDLPGRTAKEYLSMAERNVKAAFPHRFRNEARSAPAAVESTGAASRASAPKLDTSMLSDFQKHQMDIYIKGGGKASEYISQLKQLGRL